MSLGRSLDVIQVAQPCPADWNAMAGDDQKRFCSHCQKFVHNISAMSEIEAERLVCQNAGDLCVRFSRDAQTNQVLTLDYEKRATPSRRRAITVIASIGAAVVAATTFGAIRLLQKPAPPVGTGVMVGMMVAPPPSPPTGNAN